MNRQRGVALLLVLWAVATLSLLLGGLAGWVQLETRQALWQRQHTQALLAAQAGMNLALQALLDGNHRPRWIADGRAVPLAFDDARIVLSVSSERGKLDLNAASNEDITRVAQACGADRDEAIRLGRALEARRDGRAAPLRVIEELRQVPSMTQHLYQRMAPEVTLWSGLSRPDAAFASPLLRSALDLPKQTATGTDPGSVLSIDSQAQLPDGVIARLQTTVLLSPSEGNAQPYRVLRWQE
ncbi:type II secretion system protein GspK [Pseudomonas graminis]|uniref:general secretion pathway protein GspK n=1 Tax=Pseudomonas graminis TaxID=158627 RepID=UPI00234927FF|nr:type II secretion system protein GspK [Pseudomonas graminis]MDC6380614.1 type II secretion system protein GspK [Pseudomonas graminis]